MPAEAEHDVDDVPDVCTIGADERQAGQPRHIDDAVVHTHNPRPLANLPNVLQAAARRGNQSSESTSVRP